MIKWIQYLERKLAEVSQRQMNLFALRRLRRTLEAHHKGSWVVIANGDLQLIAPSLADLRGKLSEISIQWDHSFVFQAGKTVQKRSKSF